LTSFKRNSLFTVGLSLLSQIFALNCTFVAYTKSLTSFLAITTYIKRPIPSTQRSHSYDSWSKTIDFHTLVFMAFTSHKSVLVQGLNIATRTS